LVNSTSHSSLPVMKSREVHGKTKTKLYRTLIRCVFWYGSRCGYCGRLREKMLSALERRVPRKMCGRL